MIETVRRQLAVDLNCNETDFGGQGIVLREFMEKPGRRPFPVGDVNFQMLSMGGATVVSASKQLLPYLEKQLDGKTRDEAFDMPFVYGHSMYFLPDEGVKRIKCPDNITLEWYERRDMPLLYERTAAFNWFNAISYDMNHARPDVLAVMAICDGHIAGLAGASADCEDMWQIGIDVSLEHRRMGIAAALVNVLAAEIASRGKVPYYGTSASNIPSMRTAHKAGFKIAWVCAWRGVFDGLLTEANG